MLLETLVLVSLASAGPPQQQPAAETQRERIGQVFGEPVYRDQIRSGNGATAGSEVRRLFLQPVFQKYREDHAKEIDPSEEEIAAAAKHFDAEHAKRIAKNEPELQAELQQIEEQLEGDVDDELREKLELRRDGLRAQLKPPGRFFAAFVLRNWKLQKHLYDRHGGGRLLWQQAGIEAFDATRKWLEAMEAEGVFEVSDPALRKELFHYWTRDHGPFLIDDPEVIRREFVHPAWATSVTE